MNKTIVLIPHYNNPTGLERSVQSINKNENVDILIVDDGSQKEKINESIINKSFMAKGNIFYLYLDKNKGIEHALNEGLTHIMTNKYQYVARLDCGDRNLEKRFEIQESYLEKNPEIKLLGTNVICVNEKGDYLYNLKMPLKNRIIKNKMFLNCMLIHPTVMFRIDILKSIGLYPTQYKYAEDYAFFFKILNKFKVENLNNFLVQIEINKNGLSIKKRKQQVKSRIKIIKKYFYFGFYPIYGLIRSYILLYTPYSFILYLKRIRN